MFRKDDSIKPFEKRLWLSSPTMHGPELEYIKEAYENERTTLGKSVLKQLLEKIE